MSAAWQCRQRAGTFAASLPTQQQYQQLLKRVPHCIMMHPHGAAAKCAAPGVARVAHAVRAWLTAAWAVWCRLVEDTAWHPVMEKEYNNWNGSFAGNLFKLFLGSPLKLWASVGHWAIWHFDMNKFTEKQKPRVIISWLACAAFVGTVLPALYMYGGAWAVAKYWLMPWLGYHFWMSTFTVIHHTAPHIPFKAAEKWNAAKAQLMGTVHCDFPWL